MSMTILEFVAKLAEIDAAVKVAAVTSMERAAVIVEREAKAEIGHYQRPAGRFPAWPRLRPRTLREKARLGYSPPDNPLFRTGQMRASIQHRLTGVTDPVHIEAHIGANGVVPVVQETGSATVPARSFLGRAAQRKEEQIVRVIGEGYAAAWGLRGLEAPLR